MSYRAQYQLYRSQTYPAPTKLNIPVPALRSQFGGGNRREKPSGGAATAGWVKMRDTSASGTKRQHRHVRCSVAMGWEEDANMRNRAFMTPRWGNQPGERDSIPNVRWFPSRSATSKSRHTVIVILRRLDYLCAACGEFGVNRIDIFYEDANATVAR